MDMAVDEMRPVAVLLLDAGEGAPSFLVPSVRPLRHGRLAQRLSSVMAVFSDVLAGKKAAPAAAALPFVLLQSLHEEEGSYRGGRAVQAALSRPRGRARRMAADMDFLVDLVNRFAVFEGADKSAALQESTEVGAAGNVAREHAAVVAEIVQEAESTLGQRKGRMTGENGEGLSVDSADSSPQESAHSP